MTSLALVLWIAAAILLQIAVYLAIGFWNHWLEYRALRHRAEELNLPAPEEAPDEEFVSNVACWSGPRTFRQVECKKNRIAKFSLHLPWWWPWRRDPAWCSDDRIFGVAFTPTFQRVAVAVKNRRKLAV